METLHTLGLVLLMFVVLPDLDVVKAAMLTNCICFLPAFLSLLSRYSGESRRPAKVIVDIVALVAQATGFVLWPIVQWEERSWAVPVSIFLVSLTWWENYIDKRSPLRPIQKLAECKEDLRKSRYFASIFICLWKIILLLTGMMGASYITGGDVSRLFSQFTSSFRSHPITVETIQEKLLDASNVPDLATISTLEHDQVQSDAMTPIFVALIQVSASLLCYVFAKFSCKICIQGFSFAFPITLTIPVSISILIAACGIHSDDVCFFQSVIPKYLFWNCPQDTFFQDFLTNDHAWIWLFWLLSQTWIAVHIWTPKAERLATTEK